MTQDLIFEVEEGLEAIYLEPTPEMIEYPGGVQVEWMGFEASLRAHVERSLLNCGELDSAGSIFISCYGEVVGFTDKSGLEFRVFHIAESVPLLQSWKLSDSPQGYRELARSDSVEWWMRFTEKLDLIEWVQFPADDTWQYELEEQFFVCLVRALRAAVPSFAGGVYAGHPEDTAETILNRSHNLPIII